MKSESYDLCVIGAGYAGINALYAAAKYLDGDAKVLVIDKHKAVGGMWPLTYPFVRLHQPYQFFTFGDATWSLKKERTHLASQKEILDHFRETVAKIEKKLDVDFAFEQTYLGYEPSDDGVTVSFCSNATPDAITHVRTQKLIVAVGADIQSRKALHFSSTQVRSISPNHLAQISQETPSSPIPIYIMGSGKTAMDCIHWLHADPTPKRMTMIAGRGALFRNRDFLFPSSWFKRWFFGGRLQPDAIFADFILPWNGENGAEIVAKLYAENKLISLVPDAENYQAGIISQAELDFIAEGLESRIVRGHIEDIVDDSSGEPTMVLRDGTRQRIERNAVIVNCTGHFVDHALNQQPILSACGRVLTSSFYLGFSGPSAGLLTHAWYLGRLGEISDQLFVNPISGEPKAAIPFRNFLGATANAIIVADILPARVMLSNKTNMALWFPFHRRFLTALRVVRNKKVILEKAERLLR